MRRMDVVQMRRELSERVTPLPAGVKPAGEEPEIGLFTDGDAPALAREAAIITMAVLALSITARALTTTRRQS